jgi:hypothetical protein
VPAKVRAFIDFIVGSLRADIEPASPDGARAGATLEVTEAD